MPVWYEKTKPWVEAGRLVVLSITQEQHEDRCQLFAQWKGLDMPILHDPINLMLTRVVPLFVAIDEHGIVRDTRPRLDSFEERFLNATFEGPGPRAQPAGAPDLDLLGRKAEDPESARAYADALVLWGGPQRLSDAIAAYEKALGPDRSDADAHFRLGVALRMRHESDAPEPGDFQRAVDRWNAAYEIDPNQYIWYRRIQQYGPRLIKPYPFYDWVTQASQEISSRGDTPVELRVEPYGAEIAQPSRTFEALAIEAASPDPEGRVQRDEGDLIQAEVVVVPPKIAPGKTVRVHVTMRPNLEAESWWNNEAEPLRLWVAGPEGVQFSAHLLESPPGARAETREVRRLDFEVQAPEDARDKLSFSAYALYNVCEDKGGQCLLRRQDLEFEIEIAD